LLYIGQACATSCTGSATSNTVINTGTSTGCFTVTTTSQDVAGTPVVPVTSFTSALGTLDKVYLTALTATYSPTATYSVASEPATDFDLYMSLINLRATASPDSTLFSHSSGFNGAAFTGSYTEDNAPDSGGFGASSTSAQVFVAVDNTYEDSSLTNTNTHNFVPASTTSGELQTPISAWQSDGTTHLTVSSSPPTQYTDASASTWSWTWQIGTSNGAVYLSSGPTATVTATQVLTITATFQYDYHGSVTGDPQFAGFQGQQFQIHGVPEEYFALVSTPDFYMNSRFVYLANGICSYNDTECFSHPGTYIDQIAFVMNDARLKILAGPHANGLTAFLNNQPLSIGARILLPVSNSTYVHLVSRSRIIVSLDDFVFGITNSDYFFNIAAQLSNTGILTAGSTKLVVSSPPAEAAKQIATTYPEHQIHGLLGQTWRNIQWPHKKFIQGEPVDYQVVNLYSSEFPYTQYQSRK